MANYSYTTVIIKKNTEQNEQEAIDFFEQFLNEFKSFIEEENWINPYRLKKNNSPAESAKYSSATIVSIAESNSDLTLMLEGRWCSPSQLFIDLCEKYKLNLHYCDRENGCNFTHIVIIENGNVIIDEQDDYISILAIKEDSDLVFNEIIENFEDSEFVDYTCFSIESFKTYFDEEYESLKIKLINENLYNNLLDFVKNHYKNRK